MAITRIKVSNFKSFDELEVDLRPLNVVVGGNASGKSNFLEIFRFLRDLGNLGLEDAVSLQGGMEYLANLRLGASRPVSLEVSVSLLPDLAGVMGWPRNTELTCRLSLGRPVAGSGYEVLESLVAFGGEGSKMDVGRIFRVVVGISFFDFDPKLSKHFAPLTGKAHLESDGSNLALVLKNLLQDETNRERFTRILRDLLPFAEDLKVESFADRSLLLSLKESFGQHYVPASFLSDGTLQMAALVLALYFEPSAATILEEPDRNIHPHLISRMVEMLHDASAKRQVIVTTHNPELVKYTDLDDLLLVSRDKNGFSRVHRPAESKELRVFLENNLGVEDLYVQNLLGIGHGL
jgi:predicted ATPase